MIQFAVLGSGSSGNSAVVCYGETRILVDAGLSARQLVCRLQEVGIDPNRLSAIVLTHEHGDHVQGLEVFLRDRSIPVYGTVHTCHIIQQDRIKKAKVQWRKFEAGTVFRIGEIEVESFNVPHDAVDPVGFVFKCPHGRVGVVSDLGHVTHLVVERLRGVDSLFVESNYDDVMLQEDDKRPWSIKQRISNRHGHLSNKQTAELLREVASPRLHHVVLGHLSSDCNTTEKALSFARETLQELGLAQVEVRCAEKDVPTLLLSAIRGMVPGPWSSTESVLRSESAQEDIDEAIEVTIEETIEKVADRLFEPSREELTLPALVESKISYKAKKNHHTLDTFFSDSSNFEQMELSL